jgi:predicted RNA-binding Zn ribbon-like protein
MSKESYEPIESYDLVGGDVSMDLVNTASARTGPELKDKLRTYDDLVTWAERVHLAGERRAERLRRAAAHDPAEAEAVLGRAKDLREVIYRVFTADPPEATDLDALGRAAADAAAARRLRSTADGYVFAWPESDALDQLLWPIALSAAELLTSEDRVRVKECAADTCNWLFLDRSRNRSRRWCDMKDCGNRAKARRYLARKRASREQKQ